MREKAVKGLLKIIVDNKKCTPKDIKIYEYGLEGLYSLFVKTFVILIITLLLNTAKEFGLILLFYSFLRTFSFGIHAKSSIGCWVTTITIYVGGSLIVKELVLAKSFALIISCLALLSFILWAPADTPKRPLIRANQRKTQKIKTCIITLIYLLIIITLNNSAIINAISLALLIQMLCVNPITYKITKTRFNNYKYYNKVINN